MRYGTLPVALVVRSLSKDTGTSGNERVMFPGYRVFLW